MVGVSQIRKAMVSSTVLDLPVHREKVLEACLRMGGPHAGRRAIEDLFYRTVRPALSLDERIVLSSDLDGLMPAIDPGGRVPRSHVELAARRLGVTTTDIEALFRAVGERIGTRFDLDPTDPPATADLPADTSGDL